MPPPTGASADCALQPPVGGLSAVLAGLADRDGLACLQLDPDRTLLTWADPAFGPLLWRVGDAEAWQQQARERMRPRAPGQQPLAGGLVGWLGYEAGATCESMPAPRAARVLPDVALWRVDGAVLFDARADEWSVHGSAAFIAEVQALWPVLAARSAPAPVTGTGRLQAPVGMAAAYQSQVRRALDGIQAGSLYQVNLAWELTGPAAADPVAAWSALQQANPASNAALLHCGDSWILSNSPECYLQLRPGPDGLVARSLPIKGTAPRQLGPAGRAHLLDSEKERAELTMITDLVRNDLGRVARAGSVQAAPRTVRVCGDLWHAEQEVSARIRPGLDVFDVITASFPPGSVTGAPKVSAMRAIHALETGPRGVYTGAIAALGDDGHSWLSVAIRTATLTGGQARLHVGAGIVADSQPAAEWAETLAKGQALARHVMAADPAGAGP